MDTVEQERRGLALAPLLLVLLAVFIGILVWRSMVRCPAELIGDWRSDDGRIHIAIGPDRAVLDRNGAGQGRIGGGAGNAGHLIKSFAPYTSCRYDPELDKLMLMATGVGQKGPWWHETPLERLTPRDRGSNPVAILLSWLRRDPDRPQVAVKPPPPAPPPAEPALPPEALRPFAQLAGPFSSPLGFPSGVAFPNQVKLVTESGYKNLTVLVTTADGKQGVVDRKIQYITRGAGKRPIWISFAGGAPPGTPVEVDLRSFYVVAGGKTCPAAGIEDEDAPGAARRTVVADPVSRGGTDGQRKLLFVIPLRARELDLVYAPEGGTRKSIRAVLPEVP